MGNNVKLTLQELEQLAQAYMDCRLSRLQEKELELVLLCSEFSSPVIDAARDIMGLTVRLLPCNIAERAHEKKRKSWGFKYIGIAAAVATLVVCSVAFFRSPQYSAPRPETYVCVDGKVMNQYVAQSIAEETEEESMEMLRAAVEDAENEQKLATQYMNYLIK